MTDQPTKIHFHDDNLSQAVTLYAGPRSRLATMTDVVFLDGRHMIVTNLAGQQIHLLRRSRRTGRWDVIDTVITSVFGERTRTDLASLHRGTRRVAVSNCWNRSASIYRYSRWGIRHERDIPVTEEGAGFSHGVEFSPDGRHLVIVDSNRTCKVRFYDVGTGEEIYAFAEEDLRPKDASFIDRDLLAVPMCTGSPTPDAADQYHTSILLYRVAAEAGHHEQVDRVELPLAHTDGVFHDRGEVFVADQTNDVVKVYAVTGERLAFVRDIPGISFPHGIATHRDTVAVTSYGDASVNLFSRSAPRFDPVETYAVRKTRRARRHYRRQLTGFRRAEAQAAAEAKGAEAEGAEAEGAEAEASS
ncbi:MAG: hypothetical protein AAF081_05355 [Actinomycetota bacterium]